MATEAPQRYDSGNLQRRPDQQPAPHHSSFLRRNQILVNTTLTALTLMGLGWAFKGNGPDSAQGYTQSGATVNLGDCFNSNALPQNGEIDCKIPGTDQYAANLPIAGLQRKEVEGTNHNPYMEYTDPKTGQVVGYWFPNVEHGYTNKQTDQFVQNGNGLYIFTGDEFYSQQQLANGISGESGSQVQSQYGDSNFLSGSYAPNLTKEELLSLIAGKTIEFSVNSGSSVDQQAHQAYIGGVTPVAIYNLG